MKPKHKDLVNFFLYDFINLQNVGLLMPKIKISFISKLFGIPEQAQLENVRLSCIPTLMHTYEIVFSQTAFKQHPKKDILFTRSTIYKEQNYAGENLSEFFGLDKIIDWHIHNCILCPHIFCQF